MASTFSWSEDNGAATSNPARGSTRTASRTECNWKSIDDSTTSYLDSPLTPGANSYSKYQFGIIAGNFNLINNAKFGHISGTLEAGLILACKITTGYVTPSQTVISDYINLNSLSGAVLPVLFGTNPQTANQTYLTGAGNTQYCVTQLLSSTSNAGASIDPITLIMTYDES